MIFRLGRGRTCGARCAVRSATWRIAGNPQCSTFNGACKPRKWLAVFLSLVPSLLFVAGALQWANAADPTTMAGCD